MKILSLSRSAGNSGLNDFQSKLLTDAANRGHEVQSGDKKDLDVVLAGENIDVKSLRDHFGRQAFLIGIVGIPAEQLNQVIAYLKSNHFNICLAASSTSGKNELYVVTPEGGKIPLNEAQIKLDSDVAMPFWEFAERRIGVNWYKTESDASLPQLGDFDGASKGLQDLIDFTHEARFLTDHNGNLSSRLGAEYVAMSPRSVDKKLITAGDMMVVQVDQEQRIVRVNNHGRAQKSSIDSGVSDTLYRRYPSLNALIHTHSPWYVGAAKTTFPYPCGVREEAEEIQRALETINYQEGDSFLVHLVNHGRLLGLSGDLNLSKLQQQWRTVKTDFFEHMAEVKVDSNLLNGTINPILSPEGIAGYVYVDQDNAVSPRLLEQSRGKGWGRDLLNVLHQTRSTVKTVAECRVEEFYTTHGFTKVDTDGRIMTLKPSNQ